MRVCKSHPWKVALLGGAVALLGWLGWRYADQRRPTLLALNTQTGKLQWAHSLLADATYSKGPIAGDGKVLLDFCRSTSEQRCGIYQLQVFDAQAGRRFGASALKDAPLPTNWRQINPPFCNTSNSTSNLKTNCYRSIPQREYSAGQYHDADFMILLVSGMGWA